MIIEKMIQNLNRILIYDHFPINSTYMRAFCFIFTDPIIESPENQTK